MVSSREKQNNMAALSRNLPLKDKIKADRNSMSSARVSTLLLKYCLSYTHTNTQHRQQVTNEGRELVYNCCFSSWEIVHVYFLWLIGQLKMRDKETNT